MMHDIAVAWKGPAINEMAPRMLKNRNTMVSSGMNYNLRLPLPLKIYRKENPFTQLSNPQLQSSGNFRERQSIDDFQRPGGYPVVNSTSFPCMTNNPMNVLNPKPDFVSDQVSNSRSASDALRRVRSSSGIMTNKYSSSTKQYLDNRKLSFAENQFQYFRSGNANAGAAGGPLTKTNIYAAQGTNDAYRKYWLAATATPVTFQYADGHGNVFTVTVPGNCAYDIGDLDNLLQAAMIANGTSTYNLLLGTYTAPLRFGYDNLHNKIIITSSSSSSSSSGGGFSLGGAGAASIIIAASNTAFQQFIGFPAGSFPAAATASSSSIYSFQIGTVNFKPVYYKPSNYQYAQDGAVSASDRILRLKYNTVTNNGKLYSDAYGKQVASAMAYSVSDSIYYTIKDQIGYPLTRSPEIDPITGIMKSCPSTALSMSGV